MASIDCSHIKKSFASSIIIPDLSLQIADGEFVVLLGPSGCGKSTILRMVAGLEKIDSGTIRIGSRVVNDIEPGRREVAMVFQSYGLYPHMTVRDNIVFGLKRQKVPSVEIEKRLGDVAGLLKLSEFLERKPAELSGGQRQRVAMARAIVKTPKVFLFDEPLSNLDAKLREVIRIEIKKLHKRLNATTVFVTHDQIEAMTLADRIVLLRKGEIEQVGTPNEIFHTPASKFVADFIGSPGTNFWHSRIEIRDGAASAKIGGTQLPLPPRLREKLVDGQMLDIGIRPIHLHVSANKLENTFNGTVVLTENLGGSTAIIAEIDGKEISLIAGSDNSFNPGDAIKIRVDLDRLMLFDPATGRAIN